MEWNTTMQLNNGMFTSYKIFITNFNLEILDNNL